MDKTLSMKIEFGGNPVLLKLIRLCLSEFGKDFGYNPNDIYDITIAVNEICANIMEHVYRWDSNSEIVLKIKADPVKMVISIRDFGEKSLPAEFKSRDLDDMREGGLGVFLVHELMDEIRYNQNLKVGNEIILTKFRKENVEKANEV
ncbi:serine-protein kinase RsbW [bacterium BMS3Abin05]|nr:serine-protein kinase RsbW [bacterium BMS3Abin05]GBE28854.1 serine-protein kinase RsbW [bacterium BMS3Bbin03]